MPENNKTKEYQSGDAFKEKFAKNNEILRQLKLRRKELKFAAFFLQTSTLLFFLPVIPFGNILAPLIIKLMQGDKYPELKNFYRELLNFQLTFWIYLAISSLSFLIYIGWILILIVIIAWTILTIINFTKIKKSNYNYKYPYTINFFK